MAHRLGNHDRVATRDGHLTGRRRRTDDVGALPQPVCRERRHRVPHLDRRDLHDDAEFFREKRSERVGLRIPIPRHHRAEVDRYPGVASESHLAQRRPEPAVRAVVIGQHHASRTKFVDRTTKPDNQ